MGVIQVAGVAVTANAIGVVALVYLLANSEKGTVERATARTLSFRVTTLLVPVAAALGASLLLSLVALHVATFGPVVGAVSMATLFAVVFATLFVGLFGTLGLALIARLGRSRRAEGVRDGDSALDRMFRQYDAGDGDSSDGLL